MDEYRIVRFEAENFKRLKAISITPHGDMIQITGKNAQGKTSVLDAIEALLGGAACAPVEPIRHGEDKADLMLDLGKYIVRRRFTRGAKQPPITVESADGARFSSAQALLDGLLGELTFDPLAFSRMKPKEQYEELRRIAGLGDEIDKLDGLNKRDFEDRTVWNRKAKEAKEAAKVMEVPSGLPEFRVNVIDLGEELQKALEHNARIEKAKSDKQTYAAKIADLESSIGKVESSLPAEIARCERQCEEAVADLEKQIEALEARIDSARRRRDGEREQLKKDNLKGIDAIRNEIEWLKEKMASTRDDGVPADVMEIKEQMSAAEGVNAGIVQRERFEEMRSQMLAAESRAKALTGAMEERAAAKQAMIAAAKLPVAGIELQDGQVRYNGAPFEQASSAERLRVSAAIAMAMNPKLKVLLIRDGSLMDEESLAMLADLAKQSGFQIWVEAVQHGSEKVGVIIEDGAVKEDCQV